MAYIDFPEGLKGQKERKKFWLSPDGCKLIAGWRRNGIPLTKIATDYIGVSKTGFWGWYRESPELREASNVSKDICDSSVEDALYRRAIGYDYWEEVWELIEGEVIMTKKMKRHMPPDTKAIMQWLWSRLPTQWRVRQEPLEETQYTETIKNIMVAMKEVAEGKEPKEIEVSETVDA